MTSSLHLTSSSAVAAALQAADEAIEEAEQAVLSARLTEHCGENEEEFGSDKKSSAGSNNEGTDPNPDTDDLAAAFFAAQAKKMEDEIRLPIEAWTQLFPGLRLRGCSEQGESLGVSGNDIAAGSDGSNLDCTGTRTGRAERIATLRDSIKEQLVERLYREYEKMLTADISI